MNISIWGFTESFITRQWVSYTVDFKDILERNCECLLRNFPPEICKPFSPNNPFRENLFQPGYSDAYAYESQWRMEQRSHAGASAVHRKYKGHLYNLNYSVSYVIK